MWKIAIRGAVFYLLAINLVVYSLNFVITTEVNRDFYIWIGKFGTLLVMISLGYIPIKYWLRSLNKLKTWLYIHMITGGVGAFLVLLHSELYLRSFLPGTALIMMELVAFTGFLGRYLFIYTAKNLHQESIISKSNVIKEDEGDFILIVFATSTLRTWRWIHVQFTWLLLVLTVIHVITEFYWRGLRL